MPLVKIKEKYQVTIPAAIRQRLGLKAGDLLEAELKDGQIVLKPKIVIDKFKAIEKLFAALERGRKSPRHISDEEAIRDALEAIQEVRQRKHAKNRP